MHCGDASIVSMQMMRSNALRMPDKQDVVLYLALLESSHSNQKEALLLMRHALPLNPCSTTALATLATISVRSGLPRQALLAAHMIHVSTSGQEGARSLWPCGVPCHEKVTDPADPFWDADAAERAAILAEPRWQPTSPGAYAHFTLWK
jgi:hypothetical protein